MKRFPSCVKKTSKFSYEYLKKSDDKVTFFTGLNCSRFIWLFNKVKSSIKILHKKRENHMLVVLMKLKLGFFNKDLAVRFDISTSRMSKIFRSLVPLIVAHTTNLIVCPDHGTIRRHLPQSFKKNFKDCVRIIDCSEIFIERPKSLTARAQTWSNYKHNNTSKYLTGITPAGAISFLSLGWGGRVSDKQITKESGFFNKVSMGDCMLEKLSALGATLKIPSFTKGKKQLSGGEVDTSRQLSSVRIHVERVIGRIKKFRLLQTTLPLTQVDLLDDIMVIVCGLVNINNSVVPF